MYGRSRHFNSLPIPARDYSSTGSSTVFVVTDKKNLKQLNARDAAATVQSLNIGNPQLLPRYNVPLRGLRSYNNKQLRSQISFSDDDLPSNISRNLKY